MLLKGTIISEGYFSDFNAIKYQKSNIELSSTLISDNY